MSAVGPFPLATEVRAHAAEPVSFPPAALEAIAEALAPKVAALLADQVVDAPALIDVRECARRFGLTESYVRDHAEDLGVIRLGDGPRPRLHFDPDVVSERLTACSASSRSQPRIPARKAKRRGNDGLTGRKPPRLIPIRPAAGGSADRRSMGAS